MVFYECCVGSENCVIGCVGLLLSLCYDYNKVCNDFIVS